MCMCVVWLCASVMYVVCARGVCICSGVGWLYASVRYVICVWVCMW